MKVSNASIAIMFSASIAACGGGGSGDSGEGGSPPPQPPSSDELGLDCGSDSSRSVVPVIANNLVWDPVNGLIYFSVSASTGPGGNTVIAVNPESGNTVGSQFVGSEPNRMSVSDDGRYLYVAVDGSSSIKRFTLPGLEPDISFSLGVNASYGPNIALDLGVMPGSSRTLAVSLGNTSVSPMSQAGIAIYDDATARPVRAKGGQSNYFTFEWGDSPSELYAGNSETTGFDLYRIAVDSEGAKKTAQYPGVLGGFYNTIHYDHGNGLLYNDEGRVVDPATGQRVGTFVDAYGLVAPNSKQGEIFFADGATSDGDMPIRVFDPGTYQLKRTINLAVSGAPRSNFIRWGDSGLAFTTDGGCAYIAGGNGPTQGALPAVPQQTVQISGVGITASDIVWDSGKSLIYASLPSSAGSNADSIASISVDNAAVVDVVPAGSDPQKLALSDDGRYLYVGLNGESSIARFPLPSFTSDISIPLGIDENGYSQIAMDMQVVPESPRAIAVAVGRQGSSYLEGNAGAVIIFDDAVPRPEELQGGIVDGDIQIFNALQFGRSGSELLAVESQDTAFKLYRLAVSGQGVSVEKSYHSIFSDFFTGIHFDRGTGVLYFDDGHTARPESAMPVGRFPYADAAIPDSAANKYFIVTQTSDQFEGDDFTLIAYDLGKFTPIEFSILPDLDGEPIKLVRLDSDGLALLTTEDIYLIRGAIVQ